MAQVGTLLTNRYEIQSLLGEGGFGRTYEGIDRTTNTPVAIKTISLAQMGNWQPLDFFQREVEILKKLNHPSIPKYIDSFYEDTQSDRTFYLVRELAVGESLANLVKKGWRATEAEIRHILEQLLEILIYLHEQDPPVIHRDIKPSNLIYQPDEKKLFLIDFGSVMQAVGSGSLGTFVGTYGYIAPEQMRGETSAQSDIYSVAMTLAFLLTGREPAELPRQALKLNLRSLQVNASDKLLAWLDRANAPLPKDRFISAKEALQSLRSGLVKELKIPRGSKIIVQKNDHGLEILIPHNRFNNIISILSFLAIPLVGNKLLGVGLGVSVFVAVAVLFLIDLILYSGPYQFILLNEFHTVLGGIFFAIGIVFGLIVDWLEKSGLQSKTYRAIVIKDNKFISYILDANDTDNRQANKFVADLSSLTLSRINNKDYGTCISILISEKKTRANILTLRRPFVDSCREERRRPRITRGKLGFAIPLSAGELEFVYNLLADYLQQKIVKE